MGAVQGIGQELTSPAASYRAMEQGRRSDDVADFCKETRGKQARPAFSLGGREKPTAARIAFAATAINDALRGLSGTQVGELVPLLEPKIRTKLRECISGSSSQGEHRDRLPAECAQGSTGNGGGKVQG